MANPRRRYVRKPDSLVVAIRLDLDTDGLIYRKWGAEQRAKPGDWLVDNSGDIYTVDADVFSRTYRPAQRGPGTYVKTTPVWAEKAEKAGAVKTKEGQTNYQPGDYIVSNTNDDDSDQYAISAAKFEALYMPDDENAGK
jgi:hypothetical protein